MNKPVVLIMAGGKGERFWPLSRLKRPKQLLPITGGEPMIVETINRILPLTSPDEIFIITNKVQRDPIIELLPDIPPENIIGEPVGKNTAPCIGFAAALTYFKYGKDKPMIVLSADNHVQKTDIYREILKSAVARAEKEEALLTLGITPSRPDTGYGYIEMGEKVDNIEGKPIHNVNQFLEKPDLDTAKDFVAKGNYYWNSGMFIWRCGVVLEEFKKSLPQSYKILMDQENLLKEGKMDQAMEAAYPKVDAISIDFGIMEHAKKVEVIPTDVGWDDVGAWPVLERLHKADKDGNISLNPTLVYQTENCIFAGEGGENPPLIVSLGVKDLVVVQTSDAILIAHKDKLDDIKKVVKDLGEKEEYKQLT